VCQNDVTAKNVQIKSFLPMNNNANRNCNDEATIGHPHTAAHPRHASASASLNVAVRARCHWDSVEVNCKKREHKKEEEKKKKGGGGGGMSNEDSDIPVSTRP
jgi:hypothetical protein